MMKPIPKSVFRRLDKLEQELEDQDSAAQYVFLFESVTGFRIKIGITRHLPRRLREMETSTGLTLGSVRAWETNRAQEVKQRVLAALHEYRQEGEWLSGTGVFAAAVGIVDGMLGKAGK